MLYSQNFMGTESTIDNTPNYLQQGNHMMTTNCTNDCRDNYLYSLWYSRV